MIVSNFLLAIARGGILLSLFCCTTSFTWSVKSNRKSIILQPRTAHPKQALRPGLVALPNSNNSRFSLFKFSLSSSVDTVNDSSTDDTKTTSTTAENYLAMLTCLDSTKKTFQGKSVLLTGASGGLGRELALELAKCQVGTLILSGRNEDALKEVADDCQQVFASAVADSGSFSTATLQTHIVPCDLTSRDSVYDLGQTALKLCRDTGSKTVDVLINNGGVSSRSSFLETKLEVDERVMQINFFSGVSLAKALIPGMVKSGTGGTVIWVSSVQGLVGIPNRTSYAASKFAVQGYCEGLRAELAGSNVSVHVASPGYIRTNLSRSAMTGDGSNYGKMDETTANGADPKEVAVTILDSVADGKADFIVAATVSAKAAIWMRLLCPGLLRSILVKRFQKSQLSQDKDKME